MKLNKRFRLPEHPFNDRSGDAMAYAKWEYERAAGSLACFAPYYAPGDILFRKKVLDVGCGAGGKSVYYAEKFAADVTGADLLEKYREQAEAFAMRKRIGTDPEEQGPQDIYSADPTARGTLDLYCAEPETRGILDPYGADQAARGSFRFICADASDTGLPAESFDTIIMNDAFEHLADPEAVLAECARLLKPGGRVFINFPPYGHPYGEHLSDLIGIPWVHRLFPEQQCLEAYRRLAEELDEDVQSDKTGGAADTETSVPAVSGAERIAFRLSEDENGALKNSYINKMTLKRFKMIREGLAAQGSLRVVLYKEKPLRGWLAPLAKIPGVKENFVRMAVCVLEKTDPAAEEKQKTTDPSAQSEQNASRRPVSAE
ncbi:MAG: class I SAM-dependent methyltransferase, partial [Firmicutes bacterium]|nr:class I SAM-dependent methyltransferase [Bacillota bacterium]